MQASPRAVEAAPAPPVDRCDENHVAQHPNVYVTVRSGGCLYESGTWHLRGSIDLRVYGVQILNVWVEAVLVDTEGTIVDVKRDWVEPYTERFNVRFGKATMDAGEYCAYVSRIIWDDQYGPYIFRGESQAILSTCP